MSDFQIIKKLGDGAYSSVYKVKRNSDSLVYALKQVKMLTLTEKERENALNEVRILASIDEPNVISYKESFIDEASSCLCLVMEFADNGDLY
jgi:NIMA (never in mitosis gene a)-related kinase